MTTDWIDRLGFDDRPAPTAAVPAPTPSTEHVPPGEAHYNAAEVEELAKNSLDFWRH
jgi:hypothetical protein